MHWKRETLARIRSHSAEHGCNFLISSWFANTEHTVALQHIKAQVVQACRGTNTEKLFEKFLRDEEITVGRVLEALHNLGRADVVKTFQQHLPGMFTCYLYAATPSSCIPFCLVWSTAASMGSVFSEIVAKFERRSGSKRGSAGYAPAPIPAPAPAHGLQAYRAPYQAHHLSLQEVPQNFPLQQGPQSMYPVVKKEPVENWDFPLNLSLHDSVTSNSKSFNSTTPQMPYAVKQEDVEMNPVESASLDSNGHLSRHESGVSFLAGLARAQNPLTSLGLTEMGSLGRLETPRPMLRSRSPEEEHDLREINQPLDEGTRRKVEEWLQTVEPEPPEIAPEVNESPVRTIEKRKVSNSEENGGPLTKKFNPAREESSAVSQGALGADDPDRAISWPQRTKPQPEKFLSDPTRAPGSHSVGSRTWPLNKSEERQMERLLRTARPTSAASHPRVVQTQKEMYQQRPRSQPSADSGAGQGQTHVRNPLNATPRDDVTEMTETMRSLSVSMPNGIKPASHTQGKQTIEPEHSTDTGDFHVFVSAQIPCVSL